MSDRTIKLEIITPEKLFYRGNVHLVIARTLEGDEGFMAGHSWACKLLDIGELWIQEEGKTYDDFRIAAVAGGFIDVKDSIILYTDAAEWSEEIDMDRVLAQKSRAEDWLSHESEHSPDEIARAKISIEKAVTRMHVAKGGARRKR